MFSLLRQPSAYVPILLSVCVICMFLYHLNFVGAPQPQQDEGIAAHLFQLWLVAEAVLIPLFAVRSLPRKPVDAAGVLVLQLSFVLTACFPVFYFGL